MNSDGKSAGVVFASEEQVELPETQVPETAPGQGLVRATRSLISTGAECIHLGPRLAPDMHWNVHIRGQCIK